MWKPLPVTNVWILRAAIVSVWALALAVAGPKTGGAIPSQGMMLVAVTALLFGFQDWRRAWVALVPAFLWAFATMPSVWANAESIPDAVKLFRTLGFMPALAMLFGFLMVRTSPGLISVGLIVSAAVNLALMFATVSTSAEQSLNERGAVIRLYWNSVTDEAITATGAAANCIAGFLLAAWILKPARLLERGVYIALFVSSLAFGLFTGTRAPVAASVMVFALFYAAELARGKAIFKMFSTLVALIVVAFIAALSAPPELFTFLDRFQGETLFDRSFSGRDEIWADRWNHIQHRPIGYGTLEGVGYDTLSSHNLFLELMYLTGLWPGLAASLAMVALGFWCVVQLYRRSGNPEKRTLAAAVLISLLFSMFEATISSCPQAFVWTTVLIGAYLGADERGT